MDNPKFTSSEKHKFEEERAREILSYCFPSKYCDSELSESPDIVVPSLSIGVEVTQSMSPSILQNMERACSISGKTQEELTPINKKNIENGIVTTTELPTGQYLAGFSFWGDCHNIKSAFDKKIHLLNTEHFNHFRENNLFIASWDIDKDELEKGIRDILNALSISSFLWNFDIVYLWTGSKLIYIQDQSVNCVEVSTETVHTISEKSFLRIFGITRDQYYHHTTNKN